MDPYNKIIQHQKERQPSPTAVQNKEISQLIFFWQLPAGMTVEAAVVLPLFLFFFLNLMSAVEMIRLHGNLALALWENGRQMTLYGYVYDQVLEEETKENLLVELGGTFLTDAVTKGAVVSYLGKDYLEQSPLSHGVNGLNLLESSYLKKNDCIDLKLTYQVSAWTDIPLVRPFRMANRYYGRAFTGYELASEKEEELSYVYVTEYGTVYHVTLDCSYLKRQIEAVTLSEAKTRTNAAGTQYTLCWICREEERGPLVYITPDGDRYHYSLTCTSLKRVIHTVERTAAEKKYRSCSRCGGD